jgi:hypothetical protein
MREVEQDREKKTKFGYALVYKTEYVVPHNPRVVLTVQFSRSF